MGSEISWARLSANLSMSLPPTSAMTPRPNCAGRPVTLNDVSTVTSVASSRSRRRALTVAEAVPEPLASLPDAWMVSV